MGQWQPGDHLRIRRRAGHSHDVIFIGNENEEVIHLWAEGFEKSLARVRRDPLAKVVRASDTGFYRVEYGVCHDAHHVVLRAFSLLGQGRYKLTRNNCQHFARWCKTGDARSDEVERVLAVTKGAAVNRIASKIALMAPAAAAAEGLSGGASLMSGLYTIGGGTAVAGVAVVAAAPAVLAAAATCEALKDDPYLPAHERGARRRGRQAAVSGAAGGVGFTIALLHAAGITGLSAVGITTGLKTLGFGAMVRGLAIVSGLPAVAAVACAALVYSRARKRHGR